MNKQTKLVRLAIAMLIAAGFVLASGQSASAAGGSPGPKGAATTLSTTTR